jgi:hypothetical protein
VTTRLVGFNSETVRITCERGECLRMIGIRAS